MVVNPLTAEAVFAKLRGKHIRHMTDGGSLDTCPAATERLVSFLDRWQGEIYNIRDGSAVILPKRGENEILYRNRGPMRLNKRNKVILWALISAACQMVVEIRNALNMQASQCL